MDMSKRHTVDDSFIMPVEVCGKRSRRRVPEYWGSSLFGLGAGMILISAVIAGAWYRYSSAQHAEPVLRLPEPTVQNLKTAAEPPTKSMIIGQAKPSAPVRRISMKEIAELEVDQVRRPLPAVFREKPSGGMASHSESLALSSTLVKEAAAVLEGYQRAGSTDEKADYVMNKKAMLPKMRRHYMERQNTDPVTTRLVSATRIFFGSSSFLSLAYESPSHSDRQAVAIFAPSAGAGMLLDWESWTGFNDMDWSTLQKEKPQTPVWMRVTAEPGNYYNHEFADKVHYLCVKLISPDGSHSVYGYVRRSAAVAAHLIQQLRYDEYEITGRARASMRMTVRITFPPSAKSDQCVNIRQALPNRWFMFDWEAQAGL